ncbi:MAG: DNA double-strand break repair nuclease NurA [Nitrososphaeria archaeon]|nr:DNA double-strand break repair nuclease NurA [Nitrososphaeria archaeon]
MHEEYVDWLKFPPDVQHQFFQCAEEEATKLAKAIEEFVSKVKEVKSILMQHIHTLPLHDETYNVAAVDSSRSANLSERLGVRYGVFATGLIFLKGIEKMGEMYKVGTFKRKQAFSQDKSKYFFSLLTTYLERKMALEALDKCDLLILDGSFYSFLIPVERMRKSGLHGPEEDKKVNETFNLTEELRKSGKVIGVIKRSHTRAIGGYLAQKDRKTPFTTTIDKHLLSTIMPEKTYFNYQELLGNMPVQFYTSLASLITPESDIETIKAEALEKAYRPFEILGYDKSILDNMRRLQVRAYSHIPPAEIEYPSSISLEKLLKFLGQKNFFNEATNLPLCLDLVDNLVSVSQKFTGEFVSEVEGRVLEKITGNKENIENVKIFFTLLNPQKEY